MGMRSVKSSVKGWAAARLAVAIVVVHLFGLGTGWTQEPSHLGIDKEFAKQEKIYRSRGSNVPGNYVINRGLAEYAELLPTGFCGALGSLGSSDRWLDIGAGRGQAILDYYTPEDKGASGETCARSGAKARAVAISIEDRRTEKWRARAASLGEDRIQYLYGKRLGQYSPEELGTFQLITDVIGGFTYTENLSRFVERVLGLLDIGGAFYTLVQGVHLEDGTNKLGTWYLTELVDSYGRHEKICSWLKKSSCVEVTCESKGDWSTPTELIKIGKVCSDVSVPPLTLLEYQAGAPPGRRFEVVP